MARRSREPSVELRRHRRVDGTSVELWSVRYFDTAGRRRRRSCGSRQEADFERARMALEATRPSATAEADGATVLRAFWPVWLADARSRLEASTVRGHERTWSTRLEPRFGDFELREIKPRMVAQWRAELLADSVGAESVRRAMGLLQAVFTVALEWGEASDNPVKVVRKPRSGRRRLRADLHPWTATVAGDDRSRLIFGRSDGGPFRLDDWNNWRNRHFHPVTRAVGLGEPRPYDLRHSFASPLIREQRVSLVDLAEQLGHAPTMTLNTHAHVMSEYRRAVPVDLEEWIARAREVVSNSAG
jgi:integrase